MVAALALFKRIWPYLAAAAVVLGALYGAYRHGVSVERARLSAQHAGELLAQAEANAKALEDIAAQSKANLDAAMAIERANLAQQAASQAFFQTLTEQVATYVDTNPGVRDCGLDADGLRIWTEANRGTPNATRPAASRP